MANDFFKKVGKSAKDEARKLAKQIAREPVEILKETTGQPATTPEQPQKEGMSVMQEVMTDGGNVKDISAGEEQSIHSQTKSRLAQIEAELRQLRMQREQKSQEWTKEQEELMGHKEGVPQEAAPEPLEMPHSVQKGPKGPAGKKKKGGTMEQGRTKKG